MIVQNTKEIPFCLESISDQRIDRFKHKGLGIFVGIEDRKLKVEITDENKYNMFTITETLEKIRKSNPSNYKVIRRGIAAVDLDFGEYSLDKRFKAINLMNSYRSLRGY